jgi:D-alanyl-D-alanine carboxypeptidase/D-alanyl-D-alanine-endopeptidase (penicillin-binding protein 4)
VKTALQRFGIDTAKVGVADGSGVSRYNLVTPRDIVRILERISDRKNDFRRFLSALPMAGVDGSLSTRMKGTPAMGNLMAKTGTLRGVSSLSGYVTTADGEILAFSLLMQNYLSGPKDYRRVQDAIGVYLSTLRRSQF